MTSQTIIGVLEVYKEGKKNTIRNDAGAMMVVIFLIAEIRHLVVDLCNELVRPLSFLFVL